MSKRLILAPMMCLLAALGAGLALQANQEPKPVAAGAVVPFEMLPSNHMVIRVKLNGKGPYRLIFDVGSPITLLSSKAAVESKSVPADAPKSMLFGMRGEGEVGTLEMGGLKAKSVPVIVMDHPALKALGDALGYPLHGIIGYTFFAQYKTTIDYQKKTMTFVPVAFRARNLMKDLPERMMGPRVASRRMLAPQGFWGLTLGEPSGQGVLVKAVAVGSPAEVSGVKVGDVLTTLDGRWTTTLADAYAAAAGVAPGTSVAAVVVREGKDLALSVSPRDGI